MPVKSNKNHNISCSNSGVITSQIELANLTKARKSKKHCSFLVKYCKCLFFFLVFFAPSSSSTSFFFSPAVFCKFLTKFFELPGHVCYRFTHVNNISSLKTEAIFIVYVIAHFVFGHAVFFDDDIVRKHGQK